MARITIYSQRHYVIIQFNIARVITIIANIFTTQITHNFTIHIIDNR